MVRKKLQLTLVVDPRFSGGTSSAVAREIYALADICDLKVAAISSRLFKGKSVHPLLEKACEDTQTSLVWDPAVVSADLIALHNPSFLKFNKELSTKFVCDRLFAICHENPVRPDGAEGFDVAHCHALISGNTLARRKYLAPISGWNRQCTEDWAKDNPTSWCIAPVDWTNICDFEHIAPIRAPRDRRGRHSRPGIEKFAPLPEMSATFPTNCDAVRILGADSLLAADVPAHWELLPFGAENVDDFLRSIDFFVYFTHPFWQESFGRVIAEAMAAGKVVITSAATGATFSDGVVTAMPHEVDRIIAGFIDDPDSYVAQVQRGQAVLADFGVSAFQQRFATLIDKTAPPRTRTSRLEMAYDFL